MTTKHVLIHPSIHSSWHSCISEGLQQLDPEYLKELSHDITWLPGQHKIFNAFSLPVNKVNYVLFGESPYPRADSANGYAFWDAAVTELWSITGLSKPVNRATSLRNIIKMLLVAEGLLDPNHTTQADIAKLDKKHLVQSNNALFARFLEKGFLLLNTTPVLQSTPVKKDVLAWQPFIQHIIKFLWKKNPDICLLLLGNFANTINTPTHSKILSAEHPYNLSFINNPNIVNFFRPLHLLRPQG